MHFEKIEEYSFDHGLHFNTVTGEYHSLYPHDLGRPLSHEEMDYNLLYQKQTLNGWRIAGSNPDLTLNIGDLEKVLKYHQVSQDDADWARYSAAGLFDGQLVWIPVEINTNPVDPCAGFEISGTNTTPTLTSEVLTTTTQPCFDDIVVTINNVTTTEAPTTTSTTTEAPTTTTTTQTCFDDIIVSINENTTTAAPTTTAPTTAAPTTDSGSGSGTTTTTTEPTQFSNMVFSGLFRFNGPWWSTESYGPGVDPADSGQPVPPYSNMIYMDYYDNTDGAISALTFRNEVNAVNPPTFSPDFWDPNKFFGEGNHYSERNAFKIQSISDLAYSKFNHDSSTVGFPLNVQGAQGGLSYPGGGIGQLEVGMQLYGSYGASPTTSNLPSTGALLVSQVQGGPYNPDFSWQLPQGDIDEEVQDMQRNGTPLRYIIYENWIVKRVVDVAPSTSAIYPRLGFYDNRDWEELVDDWFAANPACSNGSGIPTAVTNFISNKLEDLGISTSTSVTLSASHRTRYILWLYVNEAGGTLNTALLDEFGINQGCITG